METKGDSLIAMTWAACLVMGIVFSRVARALQRRSDHGTVLATTLTLVSYASLGIALALLFMK